MSADSLGCVYPHRPIATERIIAHASGSSLRIAVARPRVSPALDPASLHDRITRTHLGGYCFFHSLNSTNLVLGLSAVQERSRSHTQTGARGWRLSEARPVLGVVCIGKERGRPVFESRREPTHCVTLITLQQNARTERYIMDVGFGRKGPIGLVPLPISEEHDAKGQVIWDDSLRGEAWRVRRPRKGELPGPAEGLEAKWMDCHPLTDDDGRRNYVMEHRLFALGEDLSEDDNVDEDEDGDEAWETLYAFNTARHDDLETFQTLSGHVFEGAKGCTTKFKDHLTISRTYDLERGPEFPDSVDTGEEARSMGRLALTDMVLSTFLTTETGKGKKEIIKEYQDEAERKQDLERLFGLKV